MTWGYKENELLCFHAVVCEIFGARYSGHLFSRLTQNLTYHDQTSPLFLLYGRES